MATSRNRRMIYMAVTVVVIIAVILAIVLPLSLADDDDNDDPHVKGETAGTAKATSRPNCYPEATDDKSDAYKQVCLSRGCVYDNANDPPCFSLAMKSAFKFEDTASRDDGFEGILTNQVDGKQNRWVLSVEYINDNLLRFSIDSEKKDRFKVPVPLHHKKKALSKPKYEFHVTDKDQFHFEVVRKESGVKIWDLMTENNNLVLTDQLLQITNKLPSDNVYGLGEHKHNSLKHQPGITWPSWARDQFPSWDEHANLYGVHPFYECVEDDQGNTHGIFMFNSNAQEYAFGNDSTLSFRTIGGILDFYIFMGPSPEEVIQQYTEMIGRPVMPAYWALGFQLCRYGYNNIDNLKNAVDSTRKYDIPQDVQYVDIDHMIEQKDFTIDEKRFPGLNDYFKTLQEGGMRIIYLLDPCLIAHDDYQPYRLVKEADGAIKWPSDENVPDDVKDSNDNLLGYVWPKDKVVFVDFFKESGKSVWKKLVKEHRTNLTFDGIWIDMNEPASFGTNLDKPWNWPEDRKPYWSLICPNNSMEDPPYRPKAAYRWDEDTRRARLSDKSICLSAIQGEDGQHSHYNVHNLYGWSQTQPTLEAVHDATGERGILITRSTFPGSGSMAGHWTGDNASIWPDLHDSIISMLEFNLFGIPYVGADICGFNNNATNALCKRWMQLGAFYPFSRNHNAINNKKQGPGQMGDKVGKASAEIMKIRYKLLPYLYSLFHKAHTSGSTVARPLHHEFPTDIEALSIDKQFLWGSNLLISPILEENQKTLNYYIPEGVWYDYFDHTKLPRNKSWHSIQVDDNSKPQLSVRGGFILVEQVPANNTHFSRQNPMSLLVALDDEGSAQGDIFWDDGVSIDTHQNGNYFSADIAAKNSSLCVSVTNKVNNNPDWQKINVNEVVVLGVSKSVNKVVLERSDGKTESIGSTKFSTTDQELKIILEDVAMAEITKLTWS